MQILSSNYLNKISSKTNLKNKQKNKQKEVNTMVNYVAVLVAALAAMVLGMVWYHPKVFGSMWMKLTGLKKKDMQKAQKEGMAGHMFIGFLATLVMVYVLDRFVNLTGAATVPQGLMLGFWLWLGFMMPLALGPVLWERKDVKLFFLNGAYWLVTVLVAAAILVSWV